MFPVHRTTILSTSIFVAKIMVQGFKWCYLQFCQNKVSGGLRGSHAACVNMQTTWVEHESGTWEVLDFKYCMELLRRPMMYHCTS